MTLSRSATAAPVTIRNWMPIVGNWRFRKGSATYLAPERGAPHPYGICVAEDHFSGGTINVKATLSEGSSGRILTHYQSPHAPYLTLGLAGYHYAYVISDFQSPLGWRNLASAGSGEVLSPGVTYQLQASFVGRQVTLSVNGIKVAEHSL